MVIFKDVTVSRKAYLVILDDENQSVEKGIRLRVHSPIIAPFASKWPALVSSFPRKAWTSEIQSINAPKSWILESVYHGAVKSVTQLSTLGRRIVDGEAKWSDDVAFIGEFRYLKGYWEWSEDILSRCENELRGANIYDPVYASLFTYDRIIDVMKAFCEAWCPSTNTLLTSAGELSISLWDLQALSGLPTLGTLYDEVIPCKEELFGVDCEGKSYVPTSCRYLFHAYHFIQREDSRRKPNSVSLEEWIKFWSKITLRYQEPSPQKEKKSTRSKKACSPTGDTEGHKPWTSNNRSLFMKLNIKEKYWTETYLAAYLACWLCSFVLPEGDANLIRPETFKMASIIAARQRVSLTIPVLTSIYRGLNIISNSSEPSLARSTFPAHFVYSWLAHYFETHFPSGLKTSVPKMIKFSGERGAKRGARYYDHAQARRRIHKWDQIPWHCTMLAKNKDILYVDDDNVDDPSHRCLFIAIRSVYLARRSGDRFVIEPYSPHRFSRQFGYHQIRPGSLTEDIREASLEDGLRYWRNCLLRKSLSRVCFPSPPSNAKKFVSTDYKNWWDRVYKNFLDDNFTILAKNEDHEPCVKTGQQTSPIPLDHPKSNDALEDKRKREKVDPPKNKRKTIPLLEDSISSNIERHWKRSRKQQEETSKPVEDLSAHGSPNKDVSAYEAEDIPDLDNREGSLESRGSTDCTQLVEAHRVTVPKDFKCVSPVGAISEFNGRGLFDNHFKSCFQKCWSDLRGRIMRTPISHMSSIKDEIYEGISRLKGFDFDLSILEKSLEELFVKAADYDRVRSKSVETGEGFAQRLEEMKAHLAGVQAKIDKEEEELASLSASLKSRRFALMSEKNRIENLKREIVELKDASLNAAKIGDDLSKSERLLNAAQKVLEDQDPFS